MIKLFGSTLLIGGVTFRREKDLSKLASAPWLISLFELANSIVLWVYLAILGFNSTV
jgi:hypothetical protein